MVRNASQIIRFSWPSTGPMKYQSSRKDEVDVRDPGDVRRRPLAAVDVDEEVAGDPEREEVDRGAADDLVGAQVDREERVDERERSARERRAEEAERPRVELVGAEDPEERAREHHPLEADVHDAAALGEDAAHRGEGERRRVAEHRRRQRRPDDHLVEVALARAGGEVAEADPEHADRDRAPAEPARAAAESTAIPSAIATRPITGRDDRLPHLQRRQRDPEGEQADEDAEPGERRLAAAGASEQAVDHPPPPRLAAAVAARRPSTERISTSAPTKRTTSPWIITVRFDASSGRKISGSRFRVDVPVTSDANSSAERPIPIALFRPSSATAIPTKAIWDEIRTSFVLIRYCPADDVDRAREAGERARDRHREEVVARDRDAAVAGRLGVEADRPHLVAERRPVERDPVDDERGERDEEADVERLQERVAPEDRQLRLLEDVVRDRDERLRVVLERAAEPEEEDADPDRDPVEHDRRDHLVRPDGRLEEAGDPGPDRADEHARDDGDEDVHEAGQARAARSRSRRP